MFYCEACSWKGWEPLVREERVSVGALRKLYDCPACGARVLNPGERLVNAFDHTCEAFLEQYRQHQAYVELSVSHWGDLPQEAAEQVRRQMAESRRTLRRNARELMRLAKRLEVFMGQVWGAQVQRQIAGVDEELRQLGREDPPLA